MFIYVNIKLWKLYLRDIGKHARVEFCEIRMDTLNRQHLGKGNLAQLSSQAPPSEGHYYLHLLAGDINAILFRNDL